MSVTLVLDISLGHARAAWFAAGGCTLLSVFREVGAEMGVPAGYSRGSWDLLLLMQVRTKDRTP